MGSNAIQIAVAVNYQVVTTASPKNFKYVKKLGASAVYDYNDSTINNDLLNFFHEKTITGVLNYIDDSA